MTQTNAGVDSTNSGSNSLALIAVGANSRRYQHVTPVFTNQQGKITYRTNGGYTEIASGLNHLVGSNWVASTEDIDITTNGGAATNGQHSVQFNANINTSGAIDLVMPDGRHLQSHILGLGYYDPSANSNVLIAVPQDSIGYVNGNQVVYSNAFKGVKADLRYTYSRGGFEQDLVLLEQPPFPANYGYNPGTTRLQLWTEFVNPPTPQVTGEANGSQFLDFGSMQMGDGKAFIIGDEADAVPVRKQWVTGGGRTSLLEEIQLSAVADQLDALPPSAANTNRSARNQFEGFPKQWPPPPKMAKQGAGSLKLASAKLPEKGFVMDYLAVTSAPNVTFQGDATYYVSGAVALSGTTTIEGGAVIKYASGTGNKITLNGPLVCNTTNYHPAVLTSVNDNSVGEAIGSGTPTNSWATYLIGGSGYSGDYKYLHFLYAGTGVSNSSTAATVWHSQFYKCGTGVASGGSGTNGNVTLRNVLMTQGTNCVYAAGTVSAEHLTGDQMQNFCAISYSGANVTNSIIAGVTNQTGVTPISTVTSGSGLFQSVAGGNYYLANLSPNRDAGATNINATLASDLKKMTTYPPILLVNNFTNDTTLSPQAQLDSDAPDYGYHYDPLDYVWSNLTVNSSVTLTLTNGVAVGMWGSTGLTVNGSLFSQGTPLNLNQVIGCCIVQEQPLAAMGTEIGGVGTWASLFLRFTDLPTLGGSVYYLPSLTDSPYSPIYPGPVMLQDCQLLGGQLYISLYTSSLTLTFTNNLFERCNVQLARSFSTVITAPPSFSTSAYNNLFHAGTLTLQYDMSVDDGSDDFGVPNPLWLWYDNLFEGVTLSETGNDEVDPYSNWLNYATSGHNAYINASSTFAEDYSYDWMNDKYPSSADYQTGPLGRYYYPTSGGNLSSLINVGGTTADLLGLYHYTVRIDEVIDGFSTVSIGFHYVAVDGNGKPLDTDGDGIPDYLKDANGNGVSDSGETNWQTPSSGISGTVGIMVFTPLKLQ